MRNRTVQSHLMSFALVSRRKWQEFQKNQPGTPRHLLIVLFTSLRGSVPESKSPLDAEFHLMAIVLRMVARGATIDMQSVTLLDMKVIKRTHLRGTG